MRGDENMIIGFLLLGLIAFIGFLVGIAIKIFVPCITLMGYVMLLSIVGVFILGCMALSSLILF